MAGAGEKAEGSQQNRDNWKELSSELIKGWESKNIWNMDETACFFKKIFQKLALK